MEPRLIYLGKIKCVSFVFVPLPQTFFSNFLIFVIFHITSFFSIYCVLSLGLILLELFCSFGSEHERATTFQDCRRGKLPLWIVSAFPFKNVAHLIISCTKPDPLERPTANEIIKLNIYKESSTTSAVADINEGVITNGLQLELRRRDKVISEQSRLLLEKDALLEKQTKDLKLMKDSLERLMDRMDRSNNKVNDP